MSNLFGTAASGKVEAEKDFSKRTLDSDIYGATIKMIFVGQAKSGARNVTIQLKTADGKDYSETIYVTNKEGKNTYEKDGKEFFLPGFLLVNNLAIMTTGKGLHDFVEDDIETKTVKLYDYDAKKELPTDVQAVVPMIGKQVMVAILEEEFAKSKLNESTKKYEPTGEYGVRNVMVKAYNPETRQTAVEMRDDKEAAQADSWLEANKGKLKTVERTAAPANQRTASAPTASGLFG
jgi:hypothetical protein